MRKQNENHQYNYEIKITYDIRNTTIYTEQSAMKMIVSFIYQKRKRDIFWKHQKTTKKTKKQNENHQYKFETKMIYNIRNMTIYIEWFIMRMIALFIYQKKRKNTSQKH